MVLSHWVFLVRFLIRHHVWLKAKRDRYETMDANFNCAVLMILLCDDASDDASMHNDCIVPQSFSINRPSWFISMYTSEINKNSYFYSVSRILCFGVIFLGVLQQYPYSFLLVGWIHLWAERCDALTECLDHSPQSKCVAGPLEFHPVRFLHLAIISDIQKKYN